MSIEDRLREALAQEAAEARPSADAWTRIQGRLDGDSHLRSGRIVAAAVALALAVGAVALAGWAFFGRRPPSPASPNLGNRIVFVRQIGSSMELHAMNADGSGLMRLGQGIDGIQPVWSPDGRRIAFASDRDGDFEIYAANADGSGTMQLTDHPAEDVQPAWSPDGTRIAFATDRDSPGQSDVYVMDADGSGQTRLTRAAGYDAGPSWSPDGARLAFVSDRDGVGTNGEIYVMDSDGRNQSRLTHGPAYDTDPDWSPDGTRIAYQSSLDGDSEIFVMYADGSGSRTELTDNDLDDAEPAWGPDGARIVFNRTNPDRSVHLWVMSDDGTGQKQLTTGPNFDSWPDWQPSPWRGIWPQDSRAEAETAQGAADGGDGHFTWQRYEEGQEVAMRYAGEVLGWDRSLSLDLEVPEGATGWFARWRLLRCGPGPNTAYPEIHCALTSGADTYEAVIVTLERLLRRDETGIWIVTRAQATTVPQVLPASVEEVTALVRAFMSRRIAGSGAEAYLSEEGEEEFGSATTGLAPLYGPRYERFDIVFADGPLWPGATTRWGSASSGRAEPTPVVPSPRPCSSDPEPASPGPRERRSSMEGGSA